MSLFKSRRQKLAELEERVANAPVVRTPAEQAWRRFRKNRLAITGAVLLIFLVLFVFIGCLVTYTFVWDLGDVGIGLMTIFNMLVLLPMSKEALACLKEYEGMMKARKQK